MTKLEEKLLELGYETYNEVYKYWRKGLIVIETFYERIEDYYVCGPRLIRTQQDIDNPQQALNQLQKDLEVLREYGNNS